MDNSMFFFCFQRISTPKMISDRIYIISLTWTCMQFLCISSNTPQNDPQYAGPNVNKSSTASGSGGGNVDMHMIQDQEEQTVQAGGKTTGTLELPKDLPLIIWWSERLNFYRHPREVDCGDFSCYSTGNRAWLSSSHTRAIYFYGTDIEPEDLPLPRSPHHEWALLHEESPMNNYMLVHAPMLRLFNHTSTFRRESDFPITTQHIPSISYLLDRKPLSLSTKNKLQKDLSLARVLYVQSHCDVASDRDRYIQELMKYIDVDSYGECLNNKQLPEDLRDPVQSMGSEKFLDFISRYKFHIAFENAICTDYITEKLFRSVHVGSVPIYRGSATARDWVPNNSIILVDDFDSPADLAAFIRKVDNDNELYLSYLSYKTKGLGNPNLEQVLKNRPWGQIDQSDGHSPDFISAFECYVCGKISKNYLNTKKESQETKPNIDRRVHLQCPQPYPSVGDITDVTSSDSWKRMDWIEDYWTGFDKGRAVTMMIQAGETNPKTFDKYLFDIFKKSVGT